MGGKHSRDIKAEGAKTVGSTGIINNTFVTNDRLTTHNPEIIILLSIIAAVLVIQLIIYCYTQHMKKVRKSIRNESKC